MTHSIRRTLLLFLMISLLAVSLVIFALLYLNAVHEIDELYDMNMEQMARALSSQFQTTGASSFSSLPDNRQDKQVRPSGEEEFLIQIWGNDGRLLYTSHPALDFPRQKGEGFLETDHNGESWRVFTLSTDKGQTQLSQPMHERDYLIDELLSQILFPLLLQIPLIGGVVWLSVGRALRPLDKMSSALSRRTAARLTPLNPAEVPREIKPLIEELNALLDRLHSAMEMQRRFTADAAHELRTPLTALQLQLDLLKRAETEGERHHFIAKLEEGISRSANLVRQLLAMARLEPEVIDPPTERFDMALLVRECIERFMPQALDRKIDLGGGRVESVLMSGEANNIRTLLGNLVDNALRYTPSGGQVDINVYARDSLCMLEITDDGTGIPPSERERVFERFYRSDGTCGQGTGLGLAMVHRIVQRHRGTISIGDGLNGKGTCVSVALPCD